MASPPEPAGFFIRLIDRLRISGNRGAHVEPQLRRGELPMFTWEDFTPRVRAGSSVPAVESSLPRAEPSSGRRSSVSTQETVTAPIPIPARSSRRGSMLSPGLEHILEEEFVPGGPPNVGLRSEAFPITPPAVVEAPSEQPVSIHLNYLRGSRDLVIPGDDRFPDRNTRIINGHWIQGAGGFKAMKVGGRRFYIPLMLLTPMYPFWSFLTTNEVPALLGQLDPDVFAVLLESVINTGAFSGTEEGLSLPLLFRALSMAANFVMDREVALLSFSIARYIYQRVMYFNPWDAGEADRLGFAYFQYRSEEIYRSWRILTNTPGLSRRLGLNAGDLVDLYVHTQPPPSLANSFGACWARFFRRSGHITLPWVNRGNYLRDNVFLSAGILRDGSASNHSSDLDEHPVLTSQFAQFAHLRAPASRQVPIASGSNPPEIPPLGLPFEDVDDPPPPYSPGTASRRAATREPTAIIGAGGGNEANGAGVEAIHVIPLPAVPANPVVDEIHVTEGDQENIYDAVDD
ncbi:hypothetical protein G7Z17_g4769 [Cylindrodendrum hubeiense]|uniref:Uncharacterized protein n=1 Tax=Cylindrodendrum hubeiense TaxID=595255 RepID=A0A9P5H8B5_9HYPO|nr:hypothetical protein G7Z17_g4769 [Cylindrodendrum hubeiense]